MIPAVGENLKLGRGALLLAPWTGGVPDTAYQKVGNITSLELSWEIEELKKKSSTQASSPVIAQAVLSQELSLVASCDEHTKENLQRFFFGTVAAANQAADSSEVKNFTDVVTGKVYDIGFRNITLISILKGSVALVANTDYVIYTTQGYIEFKDSATISDGDDVALTFSRPVVSVDHIRIGRVSEQIASLRFLADDSNQSGAGAQDVHVFHKVQVTPDGAYQLISDEYGPFSLRFLVLDDSANNPNDPLGRIERRA